MVPDWKIHEVAWPADAASAARVLSAAGEVAWLDSSAPGWQAFAAGVSMQTPRAIAWRPAARDAMPPHREAFPPERNAVPSGQYSPERGALPSRRYSLLCGRPLACLEQLEGRPAVLWIGERAVDSDASGWRLWRRVHDRLPRLPLLASGLSAGWVDYLAFELARQLERLPCSHVLDLGLPLMRLGLYERGVVLDHARRRAYAIRATGIGAALGIGEYDKHEQKADETFLAEWQRAANETCPAGGAHPVAVHFELERRRYERMVARALEYIAAGDIYQVNLAQRVRLEGLHDARATYALLRRRNPAPHAAFLSWPGGSIASLSPELFLRVRDSEVVTRPIKGTRPRTGDRLLDEIYREQLLQSAKDAAELAMIVDLHRNDLGRVCAYGSIHVRQARQVEAHPTVLHTVADIRGRLAPGRDALDALAACFPAGSISGVPKIRALEIIDELEPVARGAYTGAVGVLGLDGQMTFNVAIRTVQVQGTTGWLYVGGGIVADSDPREEYEETLAKGQGILRALGAAGERDSFAPARGRCSPRGCPQVAPSTDSCAPARGRCSPGVPRE